jgi:uncharacterized membrane protein
MPMEWLEAEICQSAAQLAAAECRWLLLIGEFDRREGAAGWELPSTAHWLNWKCGLTLGAAREHVRVGRRLAELALVRERYARGELSYSKVRAITRVATAANEQELVYLAGQMTAEHLERLVRGYRQATRDDDERDRANERHRERYVSTAWADDGSLLLSGRIPPEDGALIMAALRLIQDTLRKESGDVPAETSERAWDGWGASLADALVVMAESVIAGGINPAPGADRAQVVVHADAEVLAGLDPSGEGRCHLGDGPALPVETVQRIGCDSSLVAMVDGADGAPVAVGRKTRTIPAALRRALKARDGGCVFPGCTHHRFVDAHHIQPWSQGGATSLSNLALTCRRHHRLVHEGGYRMVMAGPGRFEFYRPDGRPVDAPPITVDRGDQALRAANAARGIHPTAESLVPGWDGGRPDYGYIIDGILAAERLHDVPAGT